MLRLTVWALALGLVDSFAAMPWRRACTRTALQKRLAMSTSSVNSAEDDDDFLGTRGSFTVLDVQPEEAGARLDRFLAARVPGQSRSYLASLCEEGHVTDARTGSALTKKAGKVKGGDTLAVMFTVNDLFTIVPEDIPLDIIYEDEVPRCRAWA